jgi:hypothetical protein
MRATTWTITVVMTASCMGDGTAPEVTVSSSAAPLTTSIQRGADSAGAFSLAAATTLATTYNVQWSGVYIGGACSAGSGWTKSKVTSFANNLHWTFMPIYVGQQSANICGAHALTTGRGMSDGQDAANIMATYDWGPNKQIPIVLDLEGGTFNVDPTGSTNYVTGWVNAVHAAGYLAYVYSSPSAVNHFGDGLGIDAVWIASYFYSGFKNLSPYDLSQIGSLFNNHNRAWQYAGDISIPGVGGVDCNTSDLVLAPAPGGTNVDTPCAQVPADGRIVDESETCFTIGGPASGMRQVSTAGYNNSLMWTYTSDAASEENFGEWSLDFVQAGKYHVEVYTAAAFAQSKQAKYVVTASGATQTVMIDQTATDGWQPLGDFMFAAGASQSVHLGDNTGEPLANNVQIVFDAVRVTPADPMGSGSGSDGGVLGGDGGGGGGGGGGNPDNPGGGKHGGCSVGGGSAGGLAPLVFAIVIGLRRRNRSVG